MICASKCDDAVPDEHWIYRLDDFLSASEALSTKSFHSARASRKKRRCGEVSGNSDKSSAMVGGIHVVLEVFFAS